MTYSPEIIFDTNPGFQIICYLNYHTFSELKCLFNIFLIIFLIFFRYLTKFVEVAFVFSDISFDVNSEGNYEFFSNISHLLCKYHSISEYITLFNRKFLNFVNSNDRSFNQSFDLLNPFYINDYFSIHFFLFDKIIFSFYMIISDLHTIFPIFFNFYIHVS